MFHALTTAIALALAVPTTNTGGVVLLGASDLSHTYDGKR